MDTLVSLFPQIIQVLLMILLIVLIAVGIRVFCIVNAVANMTKRIEMLTDVRSWFNLFQKFKAKK